jgi:hypothetical protein
MRVSPMYMVKIAIRWVPLMGPTEQACGKQILP